MTLPQLRLVSLALLALIGAVFAWRQNADPTFGGAIAPPGALWLTLTMAFFFLLPAFFVADRRLPRALRRLYAVHVAFWLVRVPVEGYLMYGPQAWVPPYGIAHDLASALILIGLAWHWRIGLGATGPVGAAQRFVPVLAAMVLIEAAFASMFYHGAGYATATLWFPDESPRFATLNAATAVANVLGLGAIAMLLAAERQQAA